MVTRDNYEACFLDYLEGRLDPDREAELLAFLENNPDLRQELEEYESYTLRPPEGKFPLKDSLKRPEEEALTDPGRQFEEFSVAWHENDLEGEQKKRFEEYLKDNPGRQKEFGMFSKVFLSPDPALVFPGKSNLKRHTISFLPYRRLLPFAVAAASVALLILSYFWLIPGRHFPADQLTQADTAAPAPSLSEKQVVKAIPVVPEQDIPVPPEVQEKMITPVEKTTRPVLQIRQSRQPETVNLPSMGVLAEIPRIETSGITGPPVTAALKEPGMYPARPEGDGAMSLQELALYQFKKTVLSQEPQNIQPGRPTIWDVADAGIRGINRFTGWEMNLQKEVDEEGKIDLLAFDSRMLQFTHRPGK